MGSCKKELELQYLHGKNYFSLDVTAGDGEKGKAAVNLIRRFIGLPVGPNSTGSSSSTHASISGKDSKIHINVCQAREGFSTLQVRGSTGRRLGRDSVVTSGDAQLSPKPAPQFVTQMSFLMSGNTEQDAHGSIVTAGCNVWRQHQVEKQHFYQESFKTVEVLDLQLRLTPVTRSGCSSSSSTPRRAENCPREAGFYSSIFFFFLSCQEKQTAAFVATRTWR